MFISIYKCFISILRSRSKPFLWLFRFNHFLKVFFEDILIQTVWSKIHVPLICQCCIIKPILEVFCFCELEMLSFYIAILHWMKCMVAKKNKTVVISFMLECVAVCVYFKFAISVVHLLKICRIVSLYLTYKIFVFKV